MKPLPSAQEIDAVYGLEPLIEPDQRERPGGSPGGTQFHWVECPYCGEAFETLVDLSAGSCTYVEDCQVCCQPIEFRIAVDPSGALDSLVVGRGD